MIFCVPLLANDVLGFTFLATRYGIPSNTAQSKKHNINTTKISMPYIIQNTNFIVNVVIIHYSTAMSLDLSILGRLAESDWENKIHFYGSDSLSVFAFVYSQIHYKAPDTSPALLIVPTDEIAKKLHDDLLVFRSDLHIYRYSCYDVSPFSGLYPNKARSAENMRFLAHAIQPNRQDVFVTSLAALAQKVLPLASVTSNTLQIKNGDELPADFFETLERLRYQSVDLVEDLGTFANKGGIVDIYSPYYTEPIRLELFGDQIESIRFFNPETQLTSSHTNTCLLIPAGGFIYDESTIEKTLHRLHTDAEKRKLNSDALKNITSQMARLSHFHEIDFFLPYLHDNLTSVLSFFSMPPRAWILNSIASAASLDSYLEEEKSLSQSAEDIVSASYDSLYFAADQVLSKLPLKQIVFDLVEMDDTDKSAALRLKNTPVLALKKSFEQSIGYKETKFQDWIRARKEEGLKIFFFINTSTKSKRVTHLFTDTNIEFTESESADSLHHLIEEQQVDANRIHIVHRDLSESMYLEEDGLLFLNETFFFGKKASRQTKNSGGLKQRVDQLHFSDLKPGDKVVHVSHGVAIFDGLKELNLNGVASELIQLSYKDNDKLYLPIFRIHQIQKYTGGNFIDKLGTKTWEKNKIKVKNALRDVASELLRLYAQRAQAIKLPFSAINEEYYRFEDAFQYDETEDQLTAIESVVSDMTSEKPMDRLVCGDVGFGKTEVAIRAAFKAVQDKRQVAVLVPTTILAFQHYDSFVKRFKSFNYTIRSLSRFTSNKAAKETLQELKDGKVDILIGTHRLLSSDVQFQEMGLLIVDEEHRFGVIHKEKIRKLKANVDTLAMSATPIPRTLNMSLVGIRDLSLITTPPEDRLPTRTFVCKKNNETIRKAIEAEVNRGGQVYFVHNRVQGIYQIEQELKELVPGVRIRVGHGQMKEDELENIMIGFFKHEFDVLLSTTIIESGIDNAKANTMIIDNAQNFGLSQLYQLRGRVGRSKERAYCYLVVPNNVALDKVAQERLRVIQENTALGSGFRVASHDMELRGAGSILGDDQSGHVNIVGYDLYLELLENALAEAKGEKSIEEEIEPDINIPIPALIPDKYILDIRTRLAYYKAMSDARDSHGMSLIEEELKDQFGLLPEEVVNLMGIMLIRRVCKDLGVRDINATKSSVTLAFTQRTTVHPEKMVGLAVSQHSKYRLTPDNRLVIKISSVEWSIILQELEVLSRILL
jgi:transcription-repair coupling factor (superfamily II helicase)